MSQHTFTLCRLTLDEVAAAAEMILAQDEAAAKEEAEEGVWHESSDEGLGGEVDSDCECDEEEGEGSGWREQSFQLPAPYPYPCKLVGGSY